MHSWFELYIGYIAGVFTTFASIPQIYLAIKTKSTKDLSYSSLIVIDLGVALWALYGGLVKDIPLVVWDTIAFVLYTMLIILKIKYDKQKENPNETTGLVTYV